MKKSVIGSIAVVVLLASLSVNAEVIFNDMIGANDPLMWAFAQSPDNPTIESSSLNTDYVARQAAGTLSSTYTVDAIGGASGVRANGEGGWTIFRTTAPGHEVTADLDINFGPSVANTNWLLRVTELVAGSTNLVSGFSHITVGSPATEGSASSVRLMTFKNGIVRLYVNGSEVNGGEPIGSIGDIFQQWITYELAFNETSNTVTVLVNRGGTCSYLGTWATSFADNDRYVEKKNRAVNGSLGIMDWYLTQLTIEIPEPTAVFFDTFGGDGFEIQPVTWSMAGQPDESASANTNLTARQVWGSLGSTYTVDSAIAGSGLRTGGDECIGNMFAPAMFRAQPGGSVTADLDADFGPSLTNRNWTLSYRSLLNGTGIGWVGFAVGNPADTQPGTAGTGLSFELFRNGSFTVWDGATSTAGDTGLGFIANVEINLVATFDEVDDTVEIIYTDATTNLSLGTFATGFSDASRFVELKTRRDGTAGTWDWRVDNLKIDTVPSIPPIGNITLEQLAGTNALALTWATASGFDYALETKTDLMAGNWTTNTMVSGTGGDVSVTTGVSEAQSFFRVTGE